MIAKTPENIYESYKEESTKDTSPSHDIPTV